MCSEAGCTYVSIVYFVRNHYISYILCDIFIFYILRDCYISRSLSVLCITLFDMILILPIYFLYVT